MKKTFLAVIIAAVFALNLPAEYAESFLSLNVSPFGEGARGFIVAFADEYNPMFYFNPANSSTSENSKLFLNYEHKFLYSNNSHYNSVAIVMPSVNSMRFGIGYVNQLISSIPIYPEYSDTVSFEPQGFFSDNANCILINASYIYYDEPLDRFSLSAGLNIKPLFHTIHENSGIGAGIDAGINAVYFLPYSSSGSLSKLSLGIAITDVGGTKIKWDTDSNTVDIREMQFKTGFSFAADVKSINSEFFFETGWHSEDNGKIGASVIYRYNKTSGIFCGMTHLTSAIETQQERSYGAGCFIDVLGLGIYYSMSTGELSLSHSVGARYRI
ncbi:MAG: hypothetical protein PHW02_08360 [bacterium]|nr:hypothetical protein [bacterium]